MEVIIMKYLVTEIQTFEGGTISTPTYAYDDRLAADSKYYAIRSSAAVSTLPVHACILATSEGRFIDGFVYHHPKVEPEPTPEEEVEPTEGE
jgi:hypothetical protein